jgi:hypothetical protein
LKNNHNFEVFSLKGQQAHFVAHQRLQSKFELHDLSKNVFWKNEFSQKVQTPH